MPRPGCPSIQPSRTLAPRVKTIPYRHSPGELVNIDTFTQTAPEAERVRRRSTREAPRAIPRDKAGEPQAIEERRKQGAGPEVLGRRPALDGVRGCAVLLVMLDHTDALGWGWIGVDVFFALSGFLITTLLIEEHDRHGRVSLKRFYQRRARRLLPALFMLLIAITVAQTRFGTFPSYWPLWQEIGSTLLYVNNWVMASGRSPLGPLTLTWSLSQEEQFYMLWPILLCVLWKMRARPTVILLVLLAMIGTIYDYLPHLAIDAHQNGYYNVFDRAGELLIGCAAAIVRRYRFTKYLTKWSVIGLAGAFVVGLSADATDYAFRPRLIVAVVAAAIVVVHAATGPRSWLNYALSFPPLRYIGRISYGLYLYHMGILMYLEQVLPHSTWETRTAIVIPVTIAIAAASWHYVESRFLAVGSSPPALGAKKKSLQHAT